MFAFLHKKNSPVKTHVGRGCLLEVFGYLFAGKLLHANVCAFVVNALLKNR